MEPHFLFGIVGAIILIVATLDILWTTLLMKGGGIITTKVTTFLWSRLLMIHRRTDSHFLLSHSGLLMVAITMLIWLSLIWLGWGLVFLSSENAVIDTNTLLSADLNSRFYYAGYIIITLGNGDFKAGSDLFKILTVFASINGFFIVTLAITYLLPLLSAVTEKRALAAYINGLGHNPVDVILRAWNGKDFGQLPQHFNNLVPLLNSLAQQQLAYPILYTFHSPHRETAFGPSLAILDEALHYFEFGFKPDSGIDKVTIYALRRSITMILSSRDILTQDENDPVPPLPDLKPLESAGFNVINCELFRNHMEMLNPRRRQLMLFIKLTGWDWQEVLESKLGSYSDVLKNPQKIHG